MIQSRTQEVGTKPRHKAKYISTQEGGHKVNTPLHKRRAQGQKENKGTTLSDHKDHK